MSKSNYYQIEMLKKEFNAAMKIRDIGKTKEIDSKINSIINK